MSQGKKMAAGSGEGTANEVSISRRSHVVIPEYPSRKSIAQAKREKERQKNKDLWKILIAAELMRGLR
ncbi:hypothetical protein SAMN05421853_11014 [Roseivivax halotolerans]|uniref:Uncharacterized protein n=1 Tax=Roseivivax halotolerans TaxID=93684 RepID=A0A1I5ZGW0_9RHOB|nr:hypothetical protein [Roseivivax halotolerans]SFQ55688.1 hypothetical protein SAMN05421853_11014 [Roseivivax halotolerans]